jgi:predicted transcriptional regulator
MSPQSKSASIKKPKHRAGRDVSPALLEGLNHPIRRQILRILSTKGTVQSPSDMAELVELGLSNVAYHTRYLAERNILRCAGTKQIRGATQHLYVSKVSDNKLVKTTLSETEKDDRHIRKRR